MGELQGLQLEGAVETGLRCLGVDSALGRDAVEPGIGNKFVELGDVVDDDVCWCDAQEVVEDVVGTGANERHPHMGVDGRDLVDGG